MLTTHVMLCRQMEAQRTSGALMMVTLSAIRSWCRLTFMNSMTPTKLVQRNPQKTEVIYFVADLDAARPEWKIGEVRKLASVSTLGVAVEPRRFVADQLLTKADVIRAMHERVQLCQDPQNLRCFAKVLASAASTTSPGYMATESCKRNELLKSTTRLGRDPLKSSSWDSQRKVRGKPHAAQASPE